MWNMTSFGILMPAIRPPKTIKWGDDRRLQIRSRRAKDLDILRAKYMPGTLGPTIHTPDKDYEYRAYCTHEAYAVAMMQMVLEIDYLKFKPTTDRFEDGELHNAYNSIWGTVLRTLSTKQHQNEYWKANPPATGKPWASYKGSTGTGWSSAVSGNKITAETSMFGASWPRSTYDSSVDRDLLEPEVWDVENVVADNALIDALYAEIDEILEAQKSAGPVDHSKCEHPMTDNARAKCRRRRRRAVSARLSALRELIDESYADAATDTSGTAEVVELPTDAVEVEHPVYKGYPWERRQLTSSTTTEN